MENTPSVIPTEHAERPMKHVFLEPSDFVIAPATITAVGNRTRVKKAFDTDCRYSLIQFIDCRHLQFEQLLQNKRKVQNKNF